MYCRPIREGDQKSDEKRLNAHTHKKKQHQQQNKKLTEREDGTWNIEQSWKYEDWTRKLLFRQTLLAPLHLPLCCCKPVVCYVWTVCSASKTPVLSIANLFCIVLGSVLRIVGFQSVCFFFKCFKISSFLSSALLSVTRNQRHSRLPACGRASLHVALSCGVLTLRGSLWSVVLSRPLVRT